MGTRADFYIGEGKDAQWLGSVAWDGYEWAEDKKCPLMKAKTEAEFLKAIKEIAKKRDDFRASNEGWPWPWDDSCTTDMAYCFKNGKVRVFNFGRLRENGKKHEFPNMKAIAKVTDGGFMILTAI